jgi:cellobiose-specific phosphotransferase system component IIA
MMSAPDIGQLRSLSSESRRTVTSAFEALDQWRDEIFSANERCLTNVLDQMAAAHRAVGWPDHVTAAAREHLLKASKVQTQMIDQVMDEWERRLKSQDIARSLPEGLTFQMPAFSDPVSEMMRLGEMTLVPFKLWIQVAEAWQRNWAAAMSGSTERRSPPPTKEAARNPGP